MNEQKVMAKTAYLALDEKKGEDICVIDISSISVWQIILSLQVE